MGVVTSDFFAGVYDGRAGISNRSHLFGADYAVGFAQGNTARLAELRRREEDDEVAA